MEPTPTRRNKRNAAESGVLAACARELHACPVCMHAHARTHQKLRVSGNNNGYTYLHLSARARGISFRSSCWRLCGVVVVAAAAGSRVRTVKAVGVLDPHPGHTSAHAAAKPPETTNSPPTQQHSTDGCSHQSTERGPHRQAELHARNQSTVSNRAHSCAYGRRVNIQQIRQATLAHKHQPQDIDEQ